MGFFIFKEEGRAGRPASIAVTAFVIAMVGPGRWSLDHALDIVCHGWTGAVIAGVAGIAGAGLQLAISYRPKKEA